MELQKKFITSNNKGKANQNRPRYIVIHDTGNKRATADALNHYNWLQNTPNTNASAHIFIDDHQAIQVIDYYTPAWHTGKLYVNKPQVPECSNFNSIGIEFCINADGNLEKTLSNTIFVITQLMSDFNIPLNHVITHQMSAGKDCPLTFIQNQQLYSNFMKNLEAVVTSSNDDTLKAALTYLAKEGVMNTPEYWIKQINDTTHLRELILNFYNALKKANEKE